MEDNFDVQIEDYEKIVGNLNYSTPTASRSASSIPDSFSLPSKSSLLDIIWQLV